MTDFLDAKRKEIRERLTELRPLVDEFRRLEAAEQALSGLDERPSERAAKPARRGSGSGSSSATRGGSVRRGRPRGGGTRSKQALELVRARPGITIPELAEAMDIKQNYLYRVMPSLAEEGLVHKSGRGWHVRPGAAETSTDESSGEAPSEQ